MSTELSVLTLLALAPLGCAGKASYDPWLVPRERFLASTRTIALSPIDVPDELEQPEPVLAIFDSLITEALCAAGFAVVPAGVVSDIWGHGTDSVGGYYDPKTGRQDTTKLNPLRRYLKQRLRAEHGADAILFPEIIVVDAPYADGTATWDGTSQAVAGFLRVLLSAITSNTLPAGTAQGLSLDVQVESVEGGVVFTNRGGIELWAKPDRDGSQLNWVPRDQLFLHPDRNRKAVRLALGSVLTREGAAPQ